MKAASLAETSQVEPFSGRETNYTNQFRLTHLCIQTIYLKAQFHNQHSSAISVIDDHSRYERKLCRCQ